MPQNLCIFEDKKFANFFPLSLTRPVFDLRIGFTNFRYRLQEEFAEVQRVVICRDYLAGIAKEGLENTLINEVPEGDTLFLNGRLLCLGDELATTLEALPANTIAVKGGYVVGASLAGEAAQDFASYIRGRISEETLAQMMEELKRLSGEAAGTGKKTRSRSRDAGEGTYEDDHALGQDNLAEKVPVPLEELVGKHGLKKIELPDARLLSFPWQLIEENPNVISDDFAKLPFRGPSEGSIVYPGVHFVEEDQVVIGEGSVIKPGTVFDASGGPIAIGDNVTIMPNCTIVGPVSIGSGSLINSGAKILDGTSIGRVCKVGGEVEGSIFHGYSNKQHDGFIGHSYLGQWVNIGAATNNSDLKNNYSAIRMWCAGAIRDTGRQFIGLIVGDHTKTGISTVFNTGTVLGFNCNVFTAEMPPKFVPSFSWGHGDDFVPFDANKAMQTAEMVMERRKVKFTRAQKKLFLRLQELSEAADRNL